MTREQHVLGGSAPGVYSMTGDDDDLNQYTVTPIDSRQYLPDGSLTSSGGATGVTNFSWTPLGELNVLHRETGNGAVRLEYMVDGLGRRIEKLVKRGGLSPARTLSRRIDDLGRRPPRRQDGGRLNGPSARFLQTTRRTSRKRTPHGWASRVARLEALGTGPASGTRVAVRRS